MNFLQEFINADIQNVMVQTVPFFPNASQCVKVIKSYTPLETALKFGLHELVLFRRGDSSGKLPFYKTSCQAFVFLENSSVDGKYLKL